MKSIRVSLLALLIIGLGCSLAPGMTFAQDNWIKQAAENYRKADEQERLRICIEAINRKVICEGCSVANLDKLFATHFVKPDPGAEGFDHLYNGGVNFGPPPLAPSKIEGMAAPAFEGWYLAFKYDKAGRIVTYSLSNIRK